MSIWDDPNLIENNDYIKFETEGTTVTGTILAMSIHEFEGGTKAPKLVLSTQDGDKTLTAGQVNLKRKLAEVKPEVGDTITITYLRSERRVGGKTLKHFDVTVERGSNPAPAKTEAATAQPTIDIDNLTPEMKELLAQMGAKKIS